MSIRARKRSDPVGSSGNEPFEWLWSRMPLAVRPQRGRSAAALTLVLMSLGAYATTPTNTITLGTPVAVDPTAAEVGTVETTKTIVLDLNGDGLPDILSGAAPQGTGEGPTVYLNNGTAVPFKNVAGVAVLPGPPPLGESASLSYGQALVADVNNDGHPDIVVPYNLGFSDTPPCCSTGLKIILNSGSAGAPFDATKAITLATPVDLQLSKLAIGDLNGDGFPDLVAVGGGLPITLFLTQGAPLSSGTFTVTTVGTDTSSANDVIIVDINGDGRPDLLIAWDTSGTSTSPRGVYTYLNNGTSTPFANVTPLKLLPGVTVLAMEVGDLNQDGKPDLAVIATPTGLANTPSTQSVLLNTGSKTQPFSIAQTLAGDDRLGGACLSISVADLNGDGLPDLQVGCISPVASKTPARALGAIYMNNGTATPFANAVPIDIPLIPVTPPDPPFVSQVGFSVAAGTFVKGGLPSVLVEANGRNGGPPAWYFPVQLRQTPVAANDAVVCPASGNCRVSVLANDYDVPGRSLTPSSLVVTASPQHGTVTVSGGVVTYKAAAGYDGTDSFEYTVRDNQGNVSNASTVSITVQAPPVAVNGSADLNGGRTVTINVLSKVTTSGYGTLDPNSIKIVVVPTHGTVTVTNGAVLYTANLGFQGNDTFRYTVSDNLGTPSNAALMTVRVRLPASNSIPLSLADVYNVNAIASDGKPPANGGVGSGYGLAAALLGPTLATEGMTFQLGAADQPDAVSKGVELRLIPQSRSGSYSALQVLATGVNGAQQNQVFCLNYNNGSKQPLFPECVTQSVSDWRTPQHFAGETVALSMAYRETPAGLRQTGPWNLYAYSLPVDPTRTLQSITIPNNRNVIVLAMSLVPPATPGAVSFATAQNVYAIAYGPLTDGGLGNYHYAGDLLGQFVVWSGIPFRLAEYQGYPDYTGATRSIIQLATGSNYSQLYLLGTGYNGSQPNQPLVLSYGDGTTVTVNQGFSDWRTPQHYPGEAVAATTAYRYALDGTKQNGPWNLYAYAIPLDKSKQLVSVQLPNAYVVVVSATLVP